MTKMSMRYVCPRCGKVVELSEEALGQQGGVIVCPRCLGEYTADGRCLGGEGDTAAGATAAAPRFCTACGARLPQSAHFCPNCGVPVAAGPGAASSSGSRPAAVPDCATPRQPGGTGPRPDARPAAPGYARPAVAPGREPLPMDALLRASSAHRQMAAAPVRHSHALWVALLLMLAVAGAVAAILML